MYASKIFTTCLFALLFTGCGEGESDPSDPNNPNAPRTACNSDADCTANQLCSAPNGLTSAESALTAEECNTLCPHACQQPERGGPLCVDVCIDACLEDRVPYCDECADTCTGDECFEACESDCLQRSGGGANPEPAPAAGSGTCINQPSAPDEPDPEPAAQLAWAGTWLVSVNYNVSCAVAFGSPNRGTAAFSVSGTMSGANNSLSMRFEPDFDMSGSGSGDRLLLSGQFAAQDDTGNIAARLSTDNNVTIRLTEITDANTASGTISGSFASRFGSICSILDGTVTFER